MDTDYDNYMLVYSCQEIYEFMHVESHSEVSPFEAWKLADKKVKEGKIQYTYPDGDLNLVPVYKEKVQILWRAREMEMQVPVTGVNETQSKKIWTHDNSTYVEQELKIKELNQFISDSLKNFTLKDLKKDYKLTRT